MNASLILKTFCGEDSFMGVEVSGNALNFMLLLKFAFLIRMISIFSGISNEWKIVQLVKLV